MITKRDREVIEFIEKFKVASTSTIAELYYPSLLVAQRRLKTIYEHKALKRDRDHFTSQYYYYINKPKQIKHCLLLSEFYAQASKLMNIEYFDTEFTHFDGIRPDGFMAAERNGKKDIYFVEIELSNAPNVDKYEELYQSGKWRIFPKFPTIIFVTNKKIRKSNLFKVVGVNEDISNLKEVMV